MEDRGVVDVKQTTEDHITSLVHLIKIKLFPLFTGGEKIGRLRQEPNQEEKCV